MWKEPYSMILNLKTDCLNRTEKNEVNDCEYYVERACINDVVE